MIAPPVDQPLLPPPPPPDLGIGAGPILQAVLALLLTCALAVLVLQLLKRGRLPGWRWLRGRDPRAGSGREVLQVLARQRLSDSQEVFLLQAAGRFLLIGAGPAGPRLLTELQKEEVARALRAPEEAQDRAREAGS